jgi:hypothetical protein
MTVIIGSLTEVTIGAVNTGFQSVQWALQVQTNRLWQLNSFLPYKTQVTAIKTVSVNTYASALPEYALPDVTTCADSTIAADIDIAIDICPGQSAAPGFSQTGMYVMSYSYNKADPQAFGTESWSYQRWVDSGVVGDEFINTEAPDLVLRGQAEGSRSGDVADTGVEFKTEGQVTGQQGSVSAGFPGLGNADDTTYGLVNNVGGGTLEEAGTTGQSNASIPHTPLYLT